MSTEITTSGVHEETFHDDDAIVGFTVSFDNKKVMKKGYKICVDKDENGVNITLRKRGTEKAKSVVVNLE